MDRTPVHDPMVIQPEQAEASEPATQTRSIEAPSPGPPSGGTSVSRGHAPASSPAAAGAYRAVFACASRPAEHPAPKTKANRGRDNEGQTGQGNTSIP
jgi:hypothetical protein